MQVKENSPLTDSNSFGFKWDSVSRANFSDHEAQKTKARRGVQNCFTNPLTSWKGTLAFWGRIKDVDLAHYRQITGKITKEEIAAVNSSVGNVFNYYTRSFRDQAGLQSWNLAAILGLWGAAYALTGYALFVKKYNILWSIAPFLPGNFYIAQ